MTLGSRSIDERELVVTYSPVSWLLGTVLTAEFERTPGKKMGRTLGMKEMRGGNSIIFEKYSRLVYIHESEQVMTTFDSLPQQRREAVEYIINLRKRELCRRTAWKMATAAIGYSQDILGRAPFRGVLDELST